MRIAVGLSRKIGMVHKMLDAAANGEIKYSKVVTYIESQCVEEEVNYVDDDSILDDDDNDGLLRDDGNNAWSTPRHGNRPFDRSNAKMTGLLSPTTRGGKDMPRTRIVPNDELRKELWYDSQGHSLLRKAVLKSAPYKLLTKLCELCPEATRVEDSKGRLVLHHACRLPVNDQTEAILLMLIEAHSVGVIHRDIAGRTPLHYLFWYHSPMRSVEIVTAFCVHIRKTKFYALRQLQDSPKGSSSVAMNLPPLPEIPIPNASLNVPNTAAIIPDAQHGCLPLHYAVMEGASVDAIQVLLQAYPLSKHVCDRYGQTPLHWYLGGHYFKHSTHVSGCDRDPNAGPWFATPIHAEIVRLLSSSRVARTIDIHGRTPLHWAAYYWAHAYHHNNNNSSNHASSGGEDERKECLLATSTAKLIVDHHIAAIAQRDKLQQTPLMTLLQTTFMLQSNHKTSLLPARFSASLASVHLLLEGSMFAASDTPKDHVTTKIEKPKNKSVEIYRGKRRGFVSTVEDANGDLPLHAALSVAAPFEIVKIILHGNTGSILQVNDKNRSPLHCAFGTNHSAQLQHKEVIELLLSKTPDLIDGRLPLKMEDSYGQYPIHLACQYGARLEILQQLVKSYPKIALLQNLSGCLPVHSVVTSQLLLSALNEKKSTVGEQERMENDDGFIASSQGGQKELNYIQEVRSKILILMEPILLSGKAPLYLTMADQSGYLPVHLMTLFGADYPNLYRVLMACPVAARQLTNDGKSVLDLHDQQLYQQDWVENQQLLFSFAATLESHRHRVELLNQCIQIVVEEVSTISMHNKDAQSSFHWRAEQKLKEEQEKNGGVISDIIFTHSLSTNIEVIESALSLEQGLSSYNTLANGTSSVSHYIPTKSALIHGKDKNKSSRRKKIHPLLGPKSFQLSKSLSDSVQDKCTKEQSKYDDTDAKLSYVLSETEYDENDSYFSEENEDDSIPEVGQTESEFDTSTDQRSGMPTNSFSSDGVASKSMDLRPSSSYSTLEEIFMNAKRKALKIENEEKKEEYNAVVSHQSIDVDTAMSSQSLLAPECGSDGSMLAFAAPPEWLSEVGMRLWAFFALFRDSNNPGDNYSMQVTNIFNCIDYGCVEALIMLPLPSCACVYFPDTPGKDLKRLVFRDAANPKCREFMHRVGFFIGTYEFQSDDGSDIALYQSDDGSSFVVKAFEWIFTTEETTDAPMPGVSEAPIWRTGEVPPEIGLAFKSLRRPVRIMFTMRRDVYDNEVLSRTQSGVPVECRGFEADNNLLPLLNHYDATDSSRNENRIFRTDSQDGRFSMMQLHGGNCIGVNDRVSLVSYPFALVYPDECSESLEELRTRCGIGGAALRKVCKAIGESLLKLHGNGVVHTNLSMADILLSKNTFPSSENDEEYRPWVLSGLSYSTPSTLVSSFAAGVTSQGYGNYATGTLPPECFTELSPAELISYQQYWTALQAQFSVHVDRKIVTPVVNMTTGQIYVVKNHFLPLTQQGGTSHNNEIPSLPYDLVPKTTSSDLWAFGLIVFHLYAGRPLFPSDCRTSHLLNYHDVCHWNEEKALEYAYEYVSDHLAQDLILRLLAPLKVRQEESIESILQHPFFDAHLDATSLRVTSIVEKRQMETAAHQRRQQSKQMEVSEIMLLEERTMKFQCWDFEILGRIYHSPTATVSRIMPPQPWRKEGTLLPFPCALLVLPYRLIEDYNNNDSSLRVHSGIAFGDQYLDFCKTVYFCASLRRSKPQSLKSIPIQDIFSTLGLSLKDFGKQKMLLSELMATKHAYQFRENPSMIALKMMQQSIERFWTTSFSTATGEAFVYLVDEHNVVPVVQEGNGDPYPLVIPDERNHKKNALKHSLTLMYLVTLYGRGISGGLLGLYKLLVDPMALDDDDSKLPASWIEAGSGLVHVLEENAWMDEIRVIVDAVSELQSSKYQVGTDDIDFWRTFLYQADPKRTFCDLRRISANGMCLWTRREGAIDISEAARAVPFKDAAYRLDHHHHHHQNNNNTSKQN